MPRVGGIYTYPAGIEGVPDQTIESADYNLFLSDVQTDANAARPITAGGTGANNATQALLNLSAERAMEQVTNYDTHVFANSGSFYSLSSASGGPVDSRNFVGIVYRRDASNLVLEARDENDTIVPGRKYVKERKAGVWSTWRIDNRDSTTAFGGNEGMSGTAADMFFGLRTSPASFLVNSESDCSGTDVFSVSKTGTASIFKSSTSACYVYVDRPAGSDCGIIGRTAGFSRWSIRLGDGTAEAGGGANTGSAFVINRYGDDGLSLGQPLNINRATGNAAFGGKVAAIGSILTAPTSTSGQLYFGLDGGNRRIDYDGTRISIGICPVEINGTLTARSSATTGSYYFGDSGTKSLGYDGAKFNFQGGNVNVVAADLTVAGQIMSAQSATTGTFNFGTSGTKNLSFNGTMFVFAGGGIAVAGDSIITGNFNVTGTSNLGPFVASQNINNVARFTIKNPNGGAAAFTILDFGTDYGDTAGEIIMNSTQNPSYAGASGMTFNLAGAASWMWNNSLGQRARLDQGGVLTIAGNLVANGVQCRAGWNGALGGNIYNLYYTGSTQLWIDNTNTGVITVTSDYRIKKDVIDLPGMWDTVKALRPIKYTQAEFSPPSHVTYVNQQKAEGKEVSSAPFVSADDIERWGFIAHELQETLTPSASTGVKDSPDTIQSPNPFTIIAALTKALQEAMVRIEALENAA